MDNHLDKFLRAQERDFEIALSEIKRGCKRSHWMWHIFPQLAGLGVSDISRSYAIANLTEATAFLKHPVLGKRLLEISKALLELDLNNATQIMGYPDDMKLRSSMTLFSLIPEADYVFQSVLGKFFDGKKDEQTVRLLGL